MKKIQCIVCNSTNWMKLPDPNSDQSITTSGITIKEPLGKSQCMECGFVQRTDYKYLGLTNFYEIKYTGYYERPGTEYFNKERYQIIANWVSSSVNDFNPESILEVGCGRGWTMSEIQKTYPNAEVQGIEPSEQNSQEARNKGFEIFTGKVEDYNLNKKKFDLIFSNHVLQHTVDPIQFLNVLGKLINVGGIIVLTVQDASTPSNELLYSDQNFSFLPFHFNEMARNVGLSILNWKKAPQDDALFLSQLIVFSNANDNKTISNQGTKFPIMDRRDLSLLYRQRCKYLEAWHKINDYLCWKTSDSKKIYNFGAGMFSYLLSCYCREYWDKILSCTVDGHKGVFLDKKVIPFSDLDFSTEHSLVLSVRPMLQKLLLNRYQNLEIDIICWDNFVSG